jgi:hypothetical protein
MLPQEDFCSCFHGQPKSIEFIKMLLKGPSQDVSVTCSEIISPEVLTHSIYGIPTPLKYRMFQKELTVVFQMLLCGECYENVTQ